MASRGVRGKKKGIPFLLPCAPMYSHASLPPYNLVPTAFPSESGRGASGSAHFLRVKPLGRGCPPQTPARHRYYPQESWYPPFTRRREHLFPNWIKQKKKNHKNDLRAEAPISFGFVAPAKEIYDAFDQHGAGCVKRRTLNLGIFDSTHWNSIFQKPWSVAWKAGVIFSSSSGKRRQAQGGRGWAWNTRHARPSCRATREPGA